MRRAGLRMALCWDAKEPLKAAGHPRDQIGLLSSSKTMAMIHSGLIELVDSIEMIPSGVELGRLLATGHRWTLVFNYASGVAGRSRTALVPGICELFRQPYTFSDPLTSAVCRDKGMAKRLVRDAGVPTAPFEVAEKADASIATTLDAPWFVKPIAEGNSTGVTVQSVVDHCDDLVATIGEYIKRFRQPVLVEEYLPGREFTVGIVGTGERSEILGVMEVDYSYGVETAAYSEINKRRRKEQLQFFLVEDSVARRVGELALLAYRLLGCRDAARIDFRLDRDGRPCFLEANCLPGLRPVDSDLPKLAKLSGCSYSRLLERILESALERLDKS